MICCVLMKTDLLSFPWTNYSKVTQFTTRYFDAVAVGHMQFYSVLFYMQFFLKY